MFIWKAILNCLPTRQNLCKRKVLYDPLCGICGLEVETVNHVLWSCGAAADVWADSESPVQKWAKTEGNFMETWIRLSEKMGTGELELVATIMRNIGSRRNSFVFEGKFQGPSVLYKQAQDCLSRMREAKMELGNRREGGNVQRDMGRWRKPRVGWVKVNWDASLNPELKRMGMRIMVRDENGELLLYLCNSIVGIFTPAAAEIQVLWRALQLCADLQWLNVIFEGDALGII
ncbi:uncharacterized protein LOC122274526 [Carya illinoinensis]|uniref:uncharacterized protein LOC122274526 n=1 Tax=Carya illinoinensis TaxID=32201 RepID=UPI001C71E384|nr:uncharacterized protein LOC122274526 [Carya illinoinensis]